MPAAFAQLFPPLPFPFYIFAPAFPVAQVRRDSRALRCATEWKDVRFRGSLQTNCTWSSESPWVSGKKNRVAYIAERNVHSLPALLQRLLFVTFPLLQLVFKAVKRLFFIISEARDGSAARN